MSEDDFQIPDTAAVDSPSSQLDIYSDAIETTVDDEFLSKNKLGLGNYSSSEYWQQVDSFQSGVYAHEAFTRRLRERAIAEAQREMAENGWDVRDAEGTVVHLQGLKDLDDGERDQILSPRKYLEDRGKEIWHSLTPDEQYQALVNIVGFERDWTPPHWRMLQMRHESSRSRDARLIDNLFGRVKEVKEESNGGPRRPKRK